MQAGVQTHIQSILIQMVAHQLTQFQESMEQLSHFQHQQEQDTNLKVGMITLAHQQIK